MPSNAYLKWRAQFKGRFLPFRGDHMFRDVPNPLGVPSDPTDSPEVRQLNIPDLGLPESDDPRGRDWVVESNRSLARALQESVRRLSNMTDEEYIGHLDREYNKVHSWIKRSREAE